MSQRFLPGVPGEAIEQIFSRAPGNEMTSGKFDSPESSAALAANAYGFFLHRPLDLPLLPACSSEAWPALSLTLEKTVRFPWSSGRHPVLDVLVTTPSELIGIESKRFEPFRKKGTPSLSDAFWRPVWGDRMAGYQRVRDQLREDGALYVSLDAAQLFKHALALMTEVNRAGEHAGMSPVLFYVYAELAAWPRGGNSITDAARAKRREEIGRFAQETAGDEVAFIPCTYRDLLSGWAKNQSPEIRAHAEAVNRSFSP